MPTRQVAPFAVDVGLGRQSLQSRAINLLQQLPARHAETPDFGRSSLRSFKKLGDRRVDLGQAVKDAMAQPPQKPSLDDKHRLFHFCFIAGTALVLLEKWRRHSRVAISA